MFLCWNYLPDRTTICFLSCYIHKVFYLPSWRALFTRAHRGMYRTMAGSSQTIISEGVVSCWRKNLLMIFVLLTHFPTSNLPFLYPVERSWWGVYWIHLVRPSICPSMLFVAMGRNLLILSDVTFKMAAWQPYWIFGFRTLTLVWLWISNPNFTGTSLMCMERSLLIFSNVIFKMAAWRPYWIFQYLDS